MKSLGILIGVIAILAPLASSAHGEAHGHYCGDFGLPPISLNYIAAQNTSCGVAKRVALQWRRKLKSGRCTISRCQSRNFRCRTLGSEQIFQWGIKCRHGRQVVGWVATVVNTE